MRSLLAAALLAAPALAGSIPYTISFDKPLYAVGELVTLTVQGPPATKGVVIFDPTPGPTTVPGLGTFGVGLSQVLALFWLPAMPPSGVLQLSTTFTCADNRVGNPDYVQVVSFDFAEQALCFSNVVVLNVQDINHVCEPHGCSPGYWKNHYETWGTSAYKPTDDFDAIFGTDIFARGVTLGDAIHSPGGEFKNLPFHAVAALLNASSHVISNFPYTEADVLTLVSNALNSGDLKQMDDLKVALDQANNLGCPL